MNVSSWVTLTYPNLPNIDCPLPADTGTWKQITAIFPGNGLSNMCWNPIGRTINILNLVTTTEKALLCFLQIKDKICDHQAIQFSLQIEKD